VALGESSARERNGKRGTYVMFQELETVGIDRERKKGFSPRRVTGIPRVRKKKRRQRFVSAGKAWSTTESEDLCGRAGEKMVIF